SDLLQMRLWKYNMLLLAAPTNHLDAFSREALEDTLLHYSGTMLIVSHDRYFINKLADRVLYMTEDGLRESIGNYDAFLEKWTGAAQDGGLFAKKAKEKKSGGSAYQARKERQANLRRMKTALARSEAEIAGLEQEIAGLEARIQSESGDYEALHTHAQALEQAQDRLEQEYARWEELQETLLELEAQA
ncbi:MAG: ABC transporter ATP-binding protein, partial [Clostridiales bacterium]|nr:ABC transporter ATP-binding protein [Clostridiales bacterium]